MHIAHCIIRIASQIIHPTTYRTNTLPFLLANERPDQVISSLHTCKRFAPSPSLASTSCSSSLGRLLGTCLEKYMLIEGFLVGRDGGGTKTELKEAKL